MIRNASSTPPRDRSASWFMSTARCVMPPQKTLTAWSSFRSLMEPCSHRAVFALILYGASLSPRGRRFDSDGTGRRPSYMETLLYGALLSPRGLRFDPFPYGAAAPHAWLTCHLPYMAQAGDTYPRPRRDGWPPRWRSREPEVTLTYYVVT